MSDALSISVNGLTQAVSRVSQAANNIAKASLTGKNSDADVVNLQSNHQDFNANATAIKTERKMQKALLGILV